MRKITAFLLSVVFSLVFIFSVCIYAAGQPATEQATLGPLDLSLEIDPTVANFQGDVSIVLKDTASDQQYQYVFRQSQSYILPDNPVKVIADKTYAIQTYIHSAAGVVIVVADGQPVDTITIPAAGAALALRVVNDTAAAAPGVTQQGGQGDLNSLIPVMDGFYQQTAYAVNGDMINHLDLWVKGSVKERFLRDPKHTSDQWDSFTTYEQANYLALTIIPYDVLFTYTDQTIDLKDKSTFVKSMDESIDYLKNSALDGGVYYEEVWKVLDWEWGYYVQDHDFVNVIDEYESLKAAGVTPASETPAAAAGDNAASPTSTPVPTVTPYSAAAQTVAPKPTEPALSASAQGNGDNTTKQIQYGLLDKLKDNIIPVAVGVGLLLIFFGMRKWKEKRSFQSEEDPDRRN